MVVWKIHVLGGVFVGECFAGVTRNMCVLVLYFINNCIGELIYKYLTQIGIFKIKYHQVRWPFYSKNILIEKYMDPNIFIEPDWILIILQINLNNKCHQVRWSFLFKKYFIIQRTRWRFEFPQIFCQVNFKKKCLIIIQLPRECF